MAESAPAKPVSKPQPAAQDPKPVAPKAVRKAPFKIGAVKRKERRLNALFYGDFGVGKSTLAASAADVEGMQDVLFIDAESGDMSLEGRPEIDAIQISTYNQFARVYEFLRLHCKARDTNDLEALSKLETHYKGLDKPVPLNQVKKYQTVVIDSITEVQKYCMYMLLGIEVGSYELDMEPQAAQFAEWGKAAEMIRLLVRSFRDLPMHVIFVAAETTTEDETKRQLKTPALPGKLSKEIQGFLDVVGYLYAASTDQGMRRRLFLEPGKTWNAKSRAQWIKKPYIDDPTMKLLMEQGA